MTAAGTGQGGTVLARASALFDEGDDEELWRLDPTSIMDEIASGLKLVNQVNGALLRLIAHAEATGPGGDEAGWTTANALVEAQPQALRTAKATVLLAIELAEHDQVSAALRAGDMSVDQARVVVQGLKEVPDTSTVELHEQIERELVEHAKTFDPAALRRIANRLIEVTCPDAADDRLGSRLEREAAQARRDRYFSWSYTAHGSLDLRGRLPIVEGEALVAVLSAHAEAAKCALDRLDPAAVPPTLAQRRADALVTVISRHQQGQLAPDQGGDRPRVMITMAYQDLVTGLHGATLTGTCDTISPSEARRLACDADLIPAVLGTDSATLDFGRKHRLFTGELRHALVLRDDGCAFPACDRPPRDCEAHHILPWWSGGSTSVSNGVLLCPHHHRTVEPDPHAPPGTRWQIRLDSRGRPELIPPVRVDPTRRPRQHARYAERDLLGG